MIYEMLQVAYTGEDDVRRRMRLDRRDDGAWDLLEERYDEDKGDYVTVGREEVRGVWVDRELHGGSRPTHDRDGVADMGVGP